METVLNHEWGGLALALPPAIVAWVFFLRARRIGRRALRWAVRAPVALIAVLATLLSIGGVFHLGQRAADAARHAPPGRLVEVDGHRMHLLAEGPTGTGATVVWIGGGYAQGLSAYRLHRMTREFVRSVLYDHAGTGWSEAAPLPRTVEHEVDDLRSLLEAAGEVGPYVMVGHSFGGLIANNFAARHRHAVAGLVLFDATPVASAALSQESPQIKLLGPLMRAAALAHAFGLSPFITTGGGFFVPPSYQAAYHAHVEAMGEMREAFGANERRVSANMAAASIIPPFMAGTTASLVREPGALGDLPMRVVYTDTLDVASWSDERKAEHRKAVASQEEWDRRLAQVEEANREVERLSSGARRMAPPAGSTHNFPHEHPEFCVQIVRELLQEIAGTRSAS